MKKKMVVFLLAGALALSITACGGDSGSSSNDAPKTEASEDAAAEEKNSEEQEEAAKEPEAKTEFGIGETAEQNGIQVTLVSAAESSGTEYIAPEEGNIFLILEFEIANNSEDDITISSIANFEAYCDDYSTSQDIFGIQAPEAEGKSQLDGSVAAGKKMNGVIAYQIPSDYQTFEINVSPSFWSSKDIKFIISK